MASISENKKQTETFKLAEAEKQTETFKPAEVEKQTVDKATAPKLVVDNSTTFEPAQQAVKKEETVKIANDKESSNKLEKVKKEVVKKTTKKKPSNDINTNAKKTSTKTGTTSKEVNVKTSLVLQYQSIEVTEETLISKVKEIWANAHKKSAKDIKSIELYVKPEEFSAYYVINDSVKGRVDL